MFPKFAVTSVPARASAPGENRAVATFSIRGKAFIAAPVAQHGRCRTGVCSGAVVSLRFQPLPVRSRWGQPGQQQGRRFPSARSARALSIRRLRVSGFTADSIQQIHSLRAIGVMLSQATKTCLSEESAALRSLGTLCKMPAAIDLTGMDHKFPRCWHPDFASQSRWEARTRHGYA